MTSKQIDKLLSILDRFASVAERWVDVEYPKPETVTEAEIYRQGHPDEPETKEAYEELEGRFEKKYRDAHPQS